MGNEPRLDKCGHGDEGDIGSIQPTFPTVALRFFGPAVNKMQMSDLAAIQSVPGKEGQRMCDPRGDESQATRGREKGTEERDQFTHREKGEARHALALRFSVNRSGRRQKKWAIRSVHPGDGRERHSFRSVQVPTVQGVQQWCFAAVLARANARKVRSALVFLQFHIL